MLEKKHDFNIFYKSMFFSFMFSLGFFVFYLENKFGGDIHVHIKKTEFFISNIKIMPEFGFQLTTYFLSKILHIAYAPIALYLLSAALTFTCYIKYDFLKNFTSAEESKIYFFTLTLMLVSAIYLPFYNISLYLGQGSPNLWHNPTLLLVKPFAFIITFLAVKKCPDFELKSLFLISFLLLVSLIFKPSFGLVFVPAWIAYIGLHYRKKPRVYLATIFICAPSLMLLFLQSYELSATSPLYTEKIIVAPFLIIKHYAPNVIKSLLLAIAFPISLLIFYHKEVLKNRYLQISWLMLIVGYIEFALLAESGRFMFAGNFGWGYYIALDLVFLFSFIELINLIRNSNAKTRIENFKLSLICILFSLHFTSGVYYLGKIIITNNYL